MKPQVFDDWYEKYDRWFETPIGRIVKSFEIQMIMEILDPRPGEKIFDGGCGTGIFTAEFLKAGSHVTGLDISIPMLAAAKRKIESFGFPFVAVAGDLLNIPLRDGVFDKTVSITAIEFIRDGEAAVKELIRITKSRGTIVVATLNSKSTWAERRKREAEHKDSIFREAIFRSPEDLMGLTALPGKVMTGIHFGKEDDPDRAIEIENKARAEGYDTGAFVVACWQKP